MSALPPKKGTKKQRPSLRGIAVEDIVRGAERLRSWPRKRGPPKHPTTLKNIAWFTGIQKATKFLDGKAYAHIAAATEKTPLLPRDLMTMIAAGRIGVFITPSGKRLYTMAVKGDVSTSLDAITAEEGFMLYRGPDGWIGIDANEVLNPDSRPKGFDIMPTMTPRTTSGAFSANFIGVRSVLVTAPGQVHAIRLWNRTADATGVYTPCVYAANALGNASTLLASGPNVTGIPAGLVDLPLSAPLDVAQGDVIALGMAKWGGSALTFPGVANQAVNYAAITAAGAPPSPAWLSTNATWPSFWARSWIE